MGTEERPVWVLELDVRLLACELDFAAIGARDVQVKRPRVIRVVDLARGDRTRFRACDRDRGLQALAHRIRPMMLAVLVGEACEPVARGAHADSCQVIFVGDRRLCRVA